MIRILFPLQKDKREFFVDRNKFIVPNQ